MLIWEKVRKLSPTVRISLRDLFFILAIQLLVLGFLNAAEMEISNKDILKRSQISYLADGGFTGIESYGVIISCVEGKISILKSLNDPTLNTQKTVVRHIGTMKEETYLELWNKLKRQGIFKTGDAPLPQAELKDEFTFHFNAMVGNFHHQFLVYGISRPEAATYFSMRSLIDSASEMQTVWASHKRLASAK